MPDAPQTNANVHIRAALRLSMLSIVWTLLASTTAVVVGTKSSNLVLIAFGCTGLLDMVGSTALVLHFRHAARHDELSERRERAALSIVTSGLIFVAGVTALESMRRLVQQMHSKSTIAGVVIAGASVVVLSGLAYRKRTLGKAVPSAALVADGWLSATGALLALVTVAGTLLSGIGWWWADPVAAEAVGVGAFTTGLLLRLQGRN